MNAASVQLFGAALAPETLLNRELTRRGNAEEFYPVRYHGSKCCEISKTIQNNKTCW